MKATHAIVSMMMVLTGFAAHAGTVEAGGNSSVGQAYHQTITNEVLSATVRVAGGVPPQGYIGDLQLNEVHTLHVLSSDFDTTFMKKGCSYDVTYKKIDAYGSVNLISAMQNSQECKDVSGTR